MRKEDPWPAEVRRFHWTEIEDQPRPKVASDPTAPAGPVGIESKASEAEILVEAARQEADALLAAARIHATEIREAARKEGYEAGLAEGRQSLREAATRWQASVQELAEFKPRLFDEARGQVVDLALAVVNKVMGPLGEADAEAVARVAARAVALVSDREVLTVRVHPEDLQNLLEAKPRLLQSLDGIKKLTVLEDHSVGRGGCLVETPTAEIDARLESQLQELVRTLKKS